jgi:hypothetical protein
LAVYVSFRPRYPTLYISEFAKSQMELGRIIRAEHTTAIHTRSQTLTNTMMFDQKVFAGGAVHFFFSFSRFPFHHPPTTR